MSKKYEINTLDDIINCVTKDNLDNFIIDLKAFLEMYISIDNLGKAIMKAEGIETDKPTLKSKGFTWIDDGKHEYKIIMEKPK
jgi:hypothetical protein